MNLVVQRARHPQLRDYIHSSVHGLRLFIQKGLVERVAVIFFNTDNVPVEKYVFKIMVNQSYGSVVEGHLKFSLRSFLIKLSVSKSLSKVPSQGCRWEITAYFRYLPQVQTSKDEELWIPTDTKQWQQPPLITPIKSMNSDPMSVQLYLEHPVCWKKSHKNLFFSLSVQICWLSFSLEIPIEGLSPSAIQDLCPQSYLKLALSRYSLFLN